MRRAWVKGVCAALCVLLLSAGICGGSFVMFHLGEEFYYSSDCWTKMYSDSDIAIEYYMLLCQAELDRDETQLLRSYEQQLDAAYTNFRYQLSNEDGDIVSTNVPNGAQVEEVTHYARSYWCSIDLAENVWQDYRIEYGVADPLLVQDKYSDALVRFEQMQDILPGLGTSAIGCLALGLALLVLLLCAAGRRRGVEGAVLNRQDRIPYDLYLAAVICLFAICWNLWFDASHWIRHDPDVGDVLSFCLAGLGSTAVAVALILTTATRIKTHTLLRSTVIWRLCRVAKRAFQALPMVWRAVALFLLYLLGSVLTGFTILLIPFYQGLVLWLICRWVLQWRRIREATGAIVAGQTDVKIDHDKFYPDLYRHAEQLNALGGAVDHAVEERLKSERFKAELITNVSHDLKTPLTSIINYVDLLKKEEISDPTAREYIEVLDRKSQRLKKLTEDLVEASKASTGTLSVSKERLNMVQLVEQAAGEYEERLSAAGLTLIAALPEEPVWVEADGRHLWRVLDNLLGNCAKYALEGTRIYLDAAAWDGKAVLSVKNISRAPLNIPPEQLMERFVRGDESRTTEGSGLGLSIARSLIELQGGTFRLSIDGDLFKATAILPLF